VNHRNRTWYPRLALVTVASMLLAAVMPIVPTAASPATRPLAWNVSQTAESVCIPENQVGIQGSFRNDDNRSMDVVATDEQTGKSVNLGSVAPNETDEFLIETGLSVVTEGKVRFDLTWTQEDDDDEDGDTTPTEPPPAETEDPTDEASPTPTETVEPAPEETPIPDDDGDDSDDTEDSDDSDDGEEEDDDSDGDDQDDDGEDSEDSDDSDSEDRKGDHDDDDEDEDEGDDTASAVLNFFSIGAVANAGGNHDEKFAEYDARDCRQPEPTPEPTQEPPPSCSILASANNEQWVSVSVDYSGGPTGWWWQLEYNLGTGWTEWAGWQNGSSPNPWTAGQTFAPGTLDLRVNFLGIGNGICGTSVVVPESPPPEPTPEPTPEPRENPQCTGASYAFTDIFREVEVTASWQNATMTSVVWEDATHFEWSSPYPDGEGSAKHIIDEALGPGPHLIQVVVTGAEGTDPSLCSPIEVTFPAPPRPTPEPKPEVSAAVQSLPQLSFCLKSPAIVLERGGEIVRLDVDLQKLVIVQETILSADLEGISTHSRISPDGCLVVFSHTMPGASQAELWTVGLNGQGLYQVTRTEDASEIQPDWASNWVIDYSAGGQLFSTDRLYTFVRDLRVAGTSPDASPDGEWVGYTDPDGNIRIVSAHTARLGDFATGLTGTNPTFDPRGTTLFYTSDAGLEAFTFANREVTTIDRSATDIARDPSNHAALLVVSGELVVVDPVDSANVVGTLTGPEAETGFRALAVEAPNLSPDWWDPNPLVPSTIGLQLFLTGNGT